MFWLDRNNAVLRWSSETISVPYINPVKTDANGRPKISQYFPDFIILYKDSLGNVKKEIVEVKPMRETKLMPGMNDREKMTYVVNQAKWKAASTFAEAQGAKFRVITEQTIFYNGRKKI